MKGNHINSINCLIEETLAEKWGNLYSQCVFQCYTCILMLCCTCCRFGDWNLKEIDYLNTLSLLTAKPVVYLVNLSSKDYIRKKNKWLPKIFEWVKVSKSSIHSREPTFVIILDFDCVLSTVSQTLNLILSIMSSLCSSIACNSYACPINTYIVVS